MPPVPGDDPATVRYPLMKDHVILRIVALLLVLVLGGCLGRTPPPKFYLLTPLDAPQASVSSEAAGLLQQPEEHVVAEDLVAGHAQMVAG